MKARSLMGVGLALALAGLTAAGCSKDDTSNAITTDKGTQPIVAPDMVTASKKIVTPTQKIVAPDMVTGTKKIVAPDMVTGTKKIVAPDMVVGTKKIVGPTDIK